MTDIPLVAVFGISGVGKSRLVSAFVADHGSFRHVTASSLMKNAPTLMGVTSEELRTANSETVAQNQWRLIEAFRADRDAHPSEAVIFDGHSIIDNDRELVRVPVEVIGALGPCAIIFVEATPESTTANRQADTSRVRPQRSIEELCEHQALALATARDYPRLLQSARSTDYSGSEWGR